MVNFSLVSTAGHQLSVIGENIQTIAGIMSTGNTADVYETILFDNIAHVQMITMELMKLVSEYNEDEDGVFASGELNDTLKEELKEEILEEIGDDEETQDQEEDE